MRTVCDMKVQFGSIYVIAWRGKAGLLIDCICCEKVHRCLTLWQERTSGPLTSARKHRTAKHCTQGDACEAVWAADGQYYAAKITSLDAGGKCTVTFVEYGEEGETMAAHCRPPSTSSLAWPLTATHSRASLLASGRHRLLCGHSLPSALLDLLASPMPSQTIVPPLTATHRRPSR